jgi:hypothetical protein
LPTLLRDNTRDFCQKLHRVHVRKPEVHHVRQIHESQRVEGSEWWEGAGLPVVVAECAPGGAPVAKMLPFEGGRLRKPARREALGSRSGRHGASNLAHCAGKGTQNSSPAKTRGTGQVKNVIASMRFWKRDNERKWQNERSHRSCLVQGRGYLPQSA